MSELPELQENVNKILALENILTKDLIACDTKWTLFVAAAQSYRYDSQLKPFPPMYLDGDTCDIDGLLNAINETPTLKVLLHNIISDVEDINLNVVDLLYWILVEQPTPTLKTVEKEDFDEVLEKVPFTQKSARPTRVFEVCYPPESKPEKIFEEYAKDHKTNFGFHGSKLDSFYSILTHGLNQHMCKTALFGEGIYLSSELSVSLNFSPFGAAWGGSTCGSVLSCVAVCEYVEDPEHCRFHVHTNKKNKIPEKYFVITNNEIVRIRYLLIFGNPTCVKPPGFRSVAMDWINNHKFTLGILCYLALLLSIGVANSRAFGYLGYITQKKTSDLLDSIKRYFDI